MYYKILKSIIFLYFVLTLPFTCFGILAATASSEPPKGITAMVLGAGVSCGWQSQILVCNPTNVLKNRLDKAVELYASGKIKTVIVSGNGGGAYYNETKTMLAYLISKSVSASNIVADYGGNSTIESCNNAKDKFGLSKVLIISQAFHLSRSVFLCRQAGLEVAVAVAKDSSTETTNYGIIREVFASWKAVGMTTKLNSWIIKLV